MTSSMEVPRETICCCTLLAKGNAVLIFQYEAGHTLMEL